MKYFSTADMSKFKELLANSNIKHTWQEYANEEEQVPYVGYDVRTIMLTTKLKYYEIRFHDINLRDAAKSIEALALIAASHV